jgi:hypothetical protein
VESRKIHFDPFLVACSQTEVKTNPPATATQALSPATDYVAGLSELPPDKILFVLVKSENSGSGICDFPPVEQGLLAFRYSSGTLEIALDGSPTWLTGSRLMDCVNQKLLVWDSLASSPRVITIWGAAFTMKFIISIN